MLSLMDPAENAVGVTPDDATDLIGSPRAIYVGGAGSLKVTLLGGSVVILAAVNEGVIYPIRVKRVWSTGTTATGLIVLF